MELLKVAQNLKLSVLIDTMYMSKLANVYCDCHEKKLKRFIERKTTMSNLLQIVENEETSEFYPTPQSLAEKMLEGIDWSCIETILEPSAGKGDILRVLTTKQWGDYHRTKTYDVDCIEIDPYLRQILKYNFSEERKDELNKEHRKIRDKYKYCDHRYKQGYVYYDDDKREYVPLPENDRQKLEELDKETSKFFPNGIHIVHDDFLTYNPFKQYDLIIMNPPFSNGDKHLLKALKIQEKGGNIICLLNAETLKNPYTETRRELLKQLEKHNAMIEFIDNAFVSAERKTGVEVALIKIAIEQVQEESDIYNRFKKAELMEDFNPEATELEVTDYIKAMVNMFNVEVKSGLELIRQYRALIPYMSCSLGGDSSYDKEPILRLTDTNERSYGSVSVNDYLKRVRSKYWRALLSNQKFVGKLTSTLQDEYRKRVSSLSDYDFTEYNIYTLSAEINSQIKKGIEEEIIEMFDRLTAEHSWYPECTKNRHYYDGWKTNSAHKIGKKVIIPCHGIFSSWDGKPRVYDAYKALADIERILNFLDGHMTEEVNSESFIKYNFERGITKNIHQKYYTATFYKKGTVHLTFTCPELIERFNIYVAQGKQWLPPNYGKASYKDMTAEEKAVVDSFQGEKAYNDIMAKSNYYLAPVTENEMLMLGE